MQAETHKITPDLVIGDFDSLGLTPNGGNVIKLPVEKDDTDVGYAIKYALERGFKDFVIYGVLGGSLDHTLANLQLASFIASEGGSCILMGDDTSATVITDGAVHFDKGNGRLSVFSLSKKAEGVNISGALYELKDATLSNDFPLGVSNAFCGTPVQISVEKGTLAIIWEAAAIPKFKG